MNFSLPFNHTPCAKNAGAVAGSTGPEQDLPRGNRGGISTCRRPAAKDGARPLALLALLTLAVALVGCEGANPTPFTSATHPAAGKIPVSVTAGVDARGNSAQPQEGIDYTAGAHVTFGQTPPWYVRAWRWLKRPLSADERDTWRRVDETDAFLRRTGPGVTP